MKIGTQLHCWKEKQKEKIWLNRNTEFSDGLNIVKILILHMNLLT